MSDSPPTTISLFSGAGGLDLGLERAGFSTRACVEWERYACETLRENRERGIAVRGGRRFLADAKIIESDIRAVSGSGLLRSARLERGTATLLAGGPPCVTFSVAGRREGLAAETGRLFEHYVRLLRAVRPAALIFENVKGLMTAIGSRGSASRAFDEIHDAIASEGYALTYRTIDAADYAVPQNRERVIILGLRGRRAPGFPDPTHIDPRRFADEAARSGREPWRDVRAAIGDLPPAAPARSVPDIANHVERDHSKEVRRSFAETPPGRRNSRFKRDRLRWDRPSKVIRAQGKPKPDGSGQKNSSHQPLHPAAHRQLTPRECARIQTFPDDFWLPPQFVNSYRLVGDAVPPALAEALGRHLMKELGLSSHSEERLAVAA